MKRINSFIICVITLALSLVSCIREEQFDNNPEGNFEALWKFVDENYCFFESKDIDWNEIYHKYKPMINNKMSPENLFQILSRMLAELKDGHVNLYTSYDMGRYWDWYLDYPRNFNEEIVERHYLTKGCNVSGGAKYRILDDNVGYIRYDSFAKPLTDSNLNSIFQYLMLCKGLIIDIRCNGGGQLTTAQRFAERFTNEEITVAYMRHKTGKGHSDFSEPIELKLKPSLNNLRWQKSVVVLTNRQCYSAANDFVNSMRYCPKVIIVGDKTGGGSGLPLSSVLPNGWNIRLSSSPITDRENKEIEFGIAPDYEVSLTKDDEVKYKDTIIEVARQLIEKARLQ